MKRARWPVLLVGIVFSACSGKASSTSPSSQPTTSRFQGTIAGPSSESGTLEITVQTMLASSFAWVPSWLSFPFVTVVHAQAPILASGTLRLVSGATITLTGNYESSTTALSLSGGGFALKGTIGNGAITGSYTGPNGSGLFSSLNSTASTVTSYCGSSLVFPDGPGALNLSVGSTGTVSGVAIASGVGLPPCSLTGRVSGSTITLTSCTGNPGTGTVDGTSVVGTTTKDGVVNGSFAASTTGCTAPASPTSPNAPTAPASPRVYTGAFSGQFAPRNSSSGGVDPTPVVCARNYQFYGTLRITLTQQGDGSVSGTADTQGTDTLLSLSSGCTFPFPSAAQFGWSGSRVSGTPGNFSFSSDSGSGVVTSISFSGGLNGGTISGSAVRSESGTQVNGNTTSIHSGSTTFGVTLR